MNQRRFVEKTPDADLLPGRSPFAARAPIDEAKTVVLAYMTFPPGPGPSCTRAVRWRGGGEIRRRRHSPGRGHSWSRTMNGPCSGRAACHWKPSFR
jgi:hypothetical protein